MSTFMECHQISHQSVIQQMDKQKNVFIRKYFRCKERQLNAMRFFDQNFFTVQN